MKFTNKMRAFIPSDTYARNPDFSDKNLSLQDYFETHELKHKGTISRNDIPDCTYTEI